MKGTWWVGKDDLGDEQREIIKLDQNRSFLTIGPPGSGKTNLLLLRANYLYLAGLKNILIIVFTRTLRDFIAIGGSNYDFPDTKVLTSITWAKNYLYEHGIKVPNSDEFLTLRKLLLVKVSEHIVENNINDFYDAILLDEAQDYSPDEINIFRRLTTRLIAAADSKQKIYDCDDSMESLSSNVEHVYELGLHYRNGQKICKLADELGKKWSDYTKMLDGCNYNEAANQSSVESLKCGNLDEEIDEIFLRLDVQLKAFPDELIGIITPRNSELELLWKRIESSPFADVSVLHGAGTHSGFGPTTRVCATTMHGAKGLEFRALHIAGCDYLKKFPNQRKLIFTAVTRCKTSLVLYHSSDLPGFLEGALSSLEPVPELPDFDDIFGGADK